MNVMVVRDLIIHIEHTHIDTDRRTNKQIHIRFLARSKSHLTNRFSCNFRLDNLLALCKNQIKCCWMLRVKLCWLKISAVPHNTGRSAQDTPPAPQAQCALQSHCALLRAGNLSRSHPWQWNHYLNRTHQDTRHPSQSGHAHEEQAGRHQRCRNYCIPWVVQGSQFVHHDYTQALNSQTENNFTVSMCVP